MKSLSRTFITVPVQLAFLGWNFLFLSITGTWLPEILLDLLREAWSGRVPWDYALSGAALLLTPLAALAAWWRIRADFRKVFQLFFGIELPLCFALLVRFGLIRELGGPAVHLLLLIGLAALALVLDLYRRRDRALTLPELAGHTVLVVTALWPAALVGLYVPPATVGFFNVVVHLAPEAWEWVTNVDIYQGAQGLLLLLAGLTFYLTTFALFLVGPLAFFYVYLSTYLRLARETARVSGRAAVGFATSAGLALCLSPAVLLASQPQVAVLARLASPPADAAARTELLADQAELRAGLLNAYLASYRYWSSTGSSKEIARLYQDIGGGEAAQALFNALAYPFLYQGNSLTGDRHVAATLYRDLFDTPIQVGERAAILRALDTTWERSTVEAGLLDVSGEKVWLARQELSVSRSGDIATVQVDETYSNRTWDQQEIYYYFSLPTSAAVTGLWLSDDPSDPERYPGVLAPRGAAQQVYLEQRQERRDPALLEQVGPRQYRLRAFPILPRAREDGAAPPLCVRFTYTTPVGAEGVPLPSLRERRNVYWDEDTVRVGVSPATDWFPAFTGEPSDTSRHVSTIGGYTVEATPAPALSPPVGGRYAVVLDRSLSMEPHAAEAEAAFRLLEALLPDADLDLYLAAGVYAGAPQLIAEPRGYDLGSPWFGALDTHALLAQYAALRGERTYDAVFALTDDGGYDVTTDPNPDPLPDLGGPLWFIHLGGALAPAYDDAVLAAMDRSGGGVATSVPEALARLASPGADTLDGYRWTVRRVSPLDSEPGADTSDHSDPFTALAARQVILAEARAARGTLADLDILHAIAKRAGVVTPYSSLLALVDDRQRARLAELEGDEDRFEREVETGDEALAGKHDAFAVTAVPEPEEWLLLGVGLAVFLVGRRRRQVSSHPEAR